MKRFFKEITLSLVLNGINIIAYLMFLFTHNLVLSIIPLFIDIICIKVSIDMIKKKENKKIEVVNLILCIVAALGAVCLFILGINILISKVTSIGA